MQDLLQTSLLLALLAGTVVNGIRLQRLRRKFNGFVNKPIKIAQPNAAKLKKESAAKEVESGWRQVDALAAVYRLIDGSIALPPTGGWAATPDFVRILLTHISEHKPKQIIECGSGTTTIAMAYMARTYGGKVVAIENHDAIAAKLELDLASRGLSDVVTVVRCELREYTYPELDRGFLWYDLKEGDLPIGAEMLVVDGPWGGLNRYARFPAGPEILPTLSRDAHIFLDDTDRPDERRLPEMWRAIEPDLGVRNLKAEKGAMEVFFLDSKMKQYIQKAA